MNTKIMRLSLVDSKVDLGLFVLDLWSWSQSYDEKNECYSESYDEKTWRYSESYDEKTWRSNIYEENIRHLNDDDSLHNI